MLDGKRTYHNVVVQFVGSIDLIGTFVECAEVHIHNNGWVSIYPKDSYDPKFLYELPAHKVDYIKRNK